ncbi:MAG: ATP-binding protein, partial [Myxococcota bacterium]|nr:ATP-binding protein [Myxococcota bacterium]
MIIKPPVRLSLPGKIFAGFVVLMMTFGGVTGYIVWEVRQLGVSLEKLHSSLVPLPSLVAELKGDYRRISLTVGLSGKEQLRRAVQHIRQVDKSPERLTETLTRIRARLSRMDSSEMIERLKSRLRAIGQQHRLMRGHLVQFFDAVSEEQSLTQSRRAARRSLAQIGRSIDLFGLEVDQALTRTIDGFAEDEARVAWGAILLVSVALFLGLAIALSANRLLRPLRALRVGVDRIARGEFGHKVETDDDGELGALAAEFNRMSDAILNRDRQLVDQQRALLHREQLATVGRMSAQITHELRNPLSSIGLNSELLLEEIAESTRPNEMASSRDLLMNIIKEVERLREITEEYLRFARLPVPELRAVDLNHAAAELLEFVRSEMERSNVKTRLDPDPAIRPTLVDPNQVRAALLNLLRNAREALPHGGHIVMRVRTIGDQTSIEVTDDGPGIPADARPQLFAPFFSTKPQGTGLGLSMVKQIVEAHRGSVQV